MRPVSAAFLEAVQHSHDVVVRVEVLDQGAVVRTLDSVSAGTVTLDATAKIRGRCDVTVADEDSDLVPRHETDLLTPYGNELRVWRGIRFPGGGEELVSLGIFVIEDTDVTAMGELRIVGRDRAARVSDARLEQIYSISAGTNYVDAIRTLILDGVPDVEFSFPSTSRVTPLLVFEERDDRWDRAVEMAESLGMTLYFDGDGVCCLRSEVPETATPVAYIVDGEGGVLVEAGKSWTRKGIYNRVIATGENSSLTEPVRAVASDDDPSSPTYYYGKFGRRPRFYSSPFIYTPEQARDAANGMLARQAGAPQQVNFGSITNPALEPGDVAAVRRLAAGIGLEAHVLDSITIPLAA